MRYIWACVVVGALLSLYLLVSGPTVVSGQDKPKARPAWEYKVLYGKQLQGYGGAKSEEEGLNKLGADGWELVGVIGLEPYYYLKRPK